MHSKITIKLSVKSFSFKFFLSLTLICSIYIIFLWILTDVKENKMKTALLYSVTCKLKCTGFMQTWTFYSHTVPRYCIILWHFRKCKATCKRVFFLKQCVLLKHTLAREKERNIEKGEGKQIVQCISPCLLDIGPIL